ncbi:MAG: hypothetical protein UR66_C0010G0011 [Candidatus Moranbacteria bacterium GW2011_GWE1_35_17]|nr:MAG: hypothetical protein UR66_C0010G0011 [Candidatus Moranbacteria bacterium GW2011_GWE1_35_17]KKP71907.1 MAG: hypothetical protein UR65_C0024G0003 [Candidatus Moranbacteria bacterium GW2011_GWE2_35_164]KKP83206.1 MAG: hypothetical protein UR83_C0038G0009 [Candidatus Moranbacteria bacterium GW2011_GWF2_35_54]
MAVFLLDEFKNLEPSFLRYNTGLHFYEIGIE